MSMNINILFDLPGKAIKTFAFSLLLCGLAAHECSGQVVACSGEAIVPYDHISLASNVGFRNTRAFTSDYWVRVGEATMIVGGLSTVAGALLILNSNNSSSLVRSESQLFLGTTFFIGGPIVVIIGGVEYLMGKRQERRGYGRYSVIGTNNSLGIAYRF